jgi:hypothetical protein
LKDYDWLEEKDKEKIIFGELYEVRTPNPVGVDLVFACLLLYLERYIDRSCKGHKSSTYQLTMTERPKAAALISLA